MEAGDAPFRTWISYEGFDPSTARRYFGEVSISIEESKSEEFIPALTAVTPWVYAETQAATFSASVHGDGVTPPITWEWDFGDSQSALSLSGGPKTTGELDTKFGLPQKVFSLLPKETLTQFFVQIKATDSAGHMRRAGYFIKVVPQPLALELEGLQRLTWTDPIGASAEYSATATGGEPLVEYSWLQAPGGGEPIVDVQLAGVPSIQIFTFDQPGDHRVRVVAEDSAGAKVPAGLVVLIEGGEALSTRMLDLPTSVEVGMPVTVQVQVRGGVLVLAGKKAGYEFHFDWGDGTKVVEEDVALTRTPNQGIGISMSHTYTEPQIRTVTATVYDATGSNKAEDVLQIEIVPAVAGTPGEPTEAVCPASITALSKPAGGGQAAVFKSFAQSSFSDDSILKRARCVYTLTCTGRR